MYVLRMIWDQYFCSISPVLVELLYTFIIKISYWWIGLCIDEQCISLILSSLRLSMKQGYGVIDVMKICYVISAFHRGYR